MPEIWFGPNVASDLLSLTDHPEQWDTGRARCSSVQIFIQQVLTDTPDEAVINRVGPNTWGLLQAVLTRLHDLGVRITMEGGGPKPNVCDGVLHADGWKRAIERLNGLGIRLSEAVLDEPLMTIASYTPNHCTLTIEQLIEPICTVIRAIRGAGIERVSIVEAFTGRPTNDTASIVQMMEGIAQAGCPASALHIDVDGNAVSAKHCHPGLTELLDACVRWKIPSGVIVIGRNNPKTDAEYTVSALEYAGQVPGLFGRWPDRLIVESWVARPETNVLDMPHNLPESDPSSHTALLAAVVALRHPNGHLTEGDQMLDWTDVKVVKDALALVADTAVPLGFPPYINGYGDKLDGKWVDAKAGETLSCGPQGWERPTPAGKDGPYEICARDGAHATYDPPGGKTQVFPFRPTLKNKPGTCSIALSDPE